MSSLPCPHPTTPEDKKSWQDLIDAHGRKIALTIFDRHNGGVFYDGGEIHYPSLPMAEAILRMKKVSGEAPTGYNLKYLDKDPTKLQKAKEFITKQIQKAKDWLQKKVEERTNIRDAHMK